MQLKCPKKVIGIFFVSFLFLLLLPQNLYAITYNSLSLSPSTGTIGTENTAIEINVNSGSDNFVGYDIRLTLTGPMDYISSSEASVCDSFEVIEGSNTLDITCLSFLSDTFVGTTSTFYFRATGDGTGSIDISNLDSSTIVGTLSGGTYTLSTGSSTSDSTSDSTLPQSGILDESPIILFIGFFLALMGGVLLIFKPSSYRRWGGTIVVIDE